MNALLTTPITARATQTSQTVNNPLLDGCALQLDARGRILRKVINQENLFNSEDGLRMSDEKFSNYIDPAHREAVEAMYLDGVRRGQLYRFIDTTIETSTGPEEVTLLLYFHPMTHQGWLFVEARNASAARTELNLAA